MTSVLLAVVLAADPGPAELNAVDQAIKEHMQGRSRIADGVALGTIRRAELAVDALSGIPLVGTISSTISASQLPFSMVIGETVLEATKKAIEERQGKHLASMLNRTVGEELADRSLEKFTAKDLEARFKVTERLRKAAKKDGLLETEKNVLLEFWRNSVEGNVEVTAKQVIQTKSDLKVLARSHGALNTHIQKLESKLGNVGAAVDELAKAAAEAEKQNKEWLKKGWSEGSFDERLAIAKACSKRNADACKDFDPGERETLPLLRDMSAA